VEKPAARVRRMRGGEMKRLGILMVLGLALAASLAAQISLGGQDQDKEKEKKKLQLPKVPRIVETVDLAAMTDAAHFNMFMQQHSFPLPEFPLGRFSTKTAAGRHYVNAVFRTVEPDALERIFLDFSESLAVNENLSPSLDNRWTVYKVTPQRSNRSGNGVLLFHNPEAGYTLQYNFSADFDRSLGTITIVLRTFASVL
jgi:hypothetical protein